MKQRYKQTEVGAIPIEWAEKRLGEIGQALIGLTYSPANVRSDGLLVLRSSNVADGTLTFEDNVFVDMDVPEKLIVKKGDILICVRNGSRELIGKCAKIDERAEGMTFGAFMAIFRTSFHDYVFHQFQSETLKRQIREHLGATINQITNASLNSFRIPLPEDVEEQRAIAGALGDVDALVGSLEKLVAKKRNLIQGVMQQLLTGQIRLAGFIGEWHVKRLAEIATLFRQNVVPALSPNQVFVHFSLPAFDAGRAPVVELGSAIGSNKFRVPPNSVLVSKLNPRIPRVWAPPDIPEHAVCSTEFLVLGPKTGVSREFLYSICRSPSFCEQMELLATGTTGSHQRMNPAEALKIGVPFPPTLGEQSTIATVISDMDAEIAALETRLVKTQALKQAMMQELLNGKTRLV